MNDERDEVADAVRARQSFEKEGHGDVDFTAQGIPEGEPYTDDDEVGEDDDDLLDDEAEEE